MLVVIIRPLQRDICPAVGYSQVCIMVVDDRVNCNASTRAFPKFAYDQRTARRQ